MYFCSNRLHICVPTPMIAIVQGTGCGCVPEKMMDQSPMSLAFLPLAQPDPFFLPKEKKNHQERESGNGLEGGRQGTDRACP